MFQSLSIIDDKFIILLISAGESECGKSFLLAKNKMGVLDWMSGNKQYEATVKS
jgi:hypothetical protein